MVERVNRESEEPSVPSCAREGAPAHRPHQARPARTNRRNDLEGWWAVENSKSDLIIPETPMLALYRELRKAPQKKRLAKATHFVEHPAELAGVFQQSVLDFTPYENDEPFYPADRKPHKPGKTVKKTYDLVLHLPTVRTLPPEDTDGRLRDSEVMNVPKKALAFSYVDKELLVHRSTSYDADHKKRTVRWSNGKVNRGGMRLDVLLANAKDNTPIIAELKIREDMDPFFALVQALGCAAHLVTGAQYKRLNNADNLPDSPFLQSGNAFRGPGKQPWVDIYVLFIDAAREEKGRYRPELKSKAEQLAPRLLAQPGINEYVRRIAGLDLKLTRPKPERKPTLVTKVRFAYERA